jgi:hypothetical protein
MRQFKGCIEPPMVRTVFGNLKLIKRMNREFKTDDFLKKYKGKSDMMSMITSDRKLKAAVTVVNLTEQYFPKQAKEQSEVMQVVYRNFVVNAVTVLEVFLKEMIQEVDWLEDGYSSLLGKSKVTLTDAYNLFAESKVSRASIISNYYSFQNLTHIDDVFTPLTGKPFIKSLYSHAIFTHGTTTTLMALPEYFKHQYQHDFDVELKRLYATRHLIVHENSEVQLSRSDLNVWYSVVQLFIFSLVAYCYGYTWKPSDQRPFATVTTIA